MLELMEAREQLIEHKGNIERLGKWLERKDTKEFLVKGFFEAVLDEAVVAMPRVSEEVKVKVVERISAVAVAKDHFNIKQELSMIDAQMDQINSAIDAQEIEEATNVAYLDEPMGR